MERGLGGPDIQHLPSDICAVMKYPMRKYLQELGQVLGRMKTVPGILRKKS